MYLRDLTTEDAHVGESFGLRLTEPYQAKPLSLVRPELQQVQLLKARFHVDALAFLSRLVHEKDIGQPE